jgi:hypothetical protein
MSKSSAIDVQPDLVSLDCKTLLIWGARKIGGGLCIKKRGNPISIKGDAGMTVICAYSARNNQIVLSQVYESNRELAPSDALNNCLSLNPELMSRPILCEDGLVSSMHRGTVQYTGMITKHDTPLWLASKDLRGTIDFYYSQFEWPFQIRFHPRGFLDGFVIDRIKNGFTVPISTRQIRKEQPYISEAHAKFAWESREQIRERAQRKLVLTSISLI